MTDRSAEGNERLTAEVAVALLVLLAVEGVTILFLGPLLSWHVFVGMMLIPPVALKLASTGYRFARYYGRSRAYLLRGPPHPLMRFVVAPVLIASTVGVLATGVAMLAVGRHGIVPGLHKVSFVIWAGAFAIHVLVYSLRLPRLIRADLRERSRGFGKLLRGVTLGGVLAAGAVLALATRPLATPLFHHRHHDERTARALPRTAVRNARGVEYRRRVSESPAVRALGLPPIGPGPIPGYVLIADRNANKLLIVSPTKRIVWQFPRAGDVRPGQSFADPDDAFFAPGYRRIVTNEEFNDAIAQIDIRSRRIVWSYGLPGVAGSGAGELSNPDDAYVWPDRTITVADIRNCRVLRLNAAKRIIGSVGSAGRCAHDPPTALLDPNGATPLPDGGMLITEIGGYVDRLDRHGRLVYSIRTPTGYPSDAQLLPDGNVLVAGFNTPGRVDILTPTGKVVWTYGPASGAGSLDRPSLAVRWPNGMIAVTDDWHHRIVVVDPHTKRIVWQYGHFAVASSADGYLSKPDGLDLLPAARTPVSSSRPAAGSRPRPVASPHVRRIGTLPAAVSRVAAVALPDGRLLAAGGLVSGASSDEVLLGTPRRLLLAGRLPVGTHDAALALVGRTAYLFGGGGAASTDAIVRIDPQTGATRKTGSIGEPLSDLGAATVGRRTYLVGGYTGTKFATAVLRFSPGTPPTVVARLPVGLRYAGVATIDGALYVAGGVTPSGERRSVLRVDPKRHTVRVVAMLPVPIAHAPLVALDGKLYLVGGRDDAGAAVDPILSIDPVSGAVTVAARLPQPLADAAAVALGSRVIVLGGADTTASDAVLSFQPRRTT